MSQLCVPVILTHDNPKQGFALDTLVSFDTTFDVLNILIHVQKTSLLEERLSGIRKAARQLESQGIRSVKLDGQLWNLEECFAFWQGFYHSKNRITIDFDKLELPQNERKQLGELIRISSWVRDIINQPSDVLGPNDLAEACLTLLKEVGGDAISFEKISGEALAEKGYQGIYTVGKGSGLPPVYLRVDFNPSKQADALTQTCLVGKGITFDSGGYSLKQSQFMDSMKSDMGGAALATGALAYSILSGLSQRTQLILCCAENMVSANAFKLGDVIHYRNNVSVEVLNTDAEGRLVLADGLIDASVIKPRYIIDCATLTGAAKVALSNDYHAAFSFDDDMMSQFLATALEENEPFWRLPLAKFHRTQFPSSFATISNTNAAAYTAGASTAAAFLSYFVTEYQNNWLHIDCAATYRKSSVDGWSTGATGIGVRTLAHFILNPQKDSKDSVEL